MDFSKDFGNYNVYGKREENLGGMIKRTFTLKNLEVGLYDVFEKTKLILCYINQEKRTVVQLHFTSWPNHDIPLTTSGMMRLRKLVNKEHAKFNIGSPIIIHCRCMFMCKCDCTA